MFKGLGDCLTQSSIILKYKLQIKCLIAHWFKTWAFKGRISFAYFPSLDITRPALKAQVNNRSLAPSQVLPWASSHVPFPVPSRTPFRASSYMPFQCRPVHRPALRPILPSMSRCISRSTWRRLLARPPSKRCIRPRL